MLWQPALPDDYRHLTDEQLDARILQQKKALGHRLVILGHHYQQDDVIKYADFTGDSFKLSQLAAERVEEVGADFVIFCGVHFMAESADILTPDHVQVILPDMGAGCSMADMADADDTVDAWNAINDAIANNPGDGTTTRVIPICYMNSTAAIKAFVGEHGGAVCTSSNCDKVFAWALNGGEVPRAEGEQIKILFIPDQHLGRNTAAACGYDITTDMIVWDPRDPAGLGGNDEADIRQATFILWKGHCSVHKLFRPEHIDQIRAQWPDVTVMVHPECAYEVVQKADLSGSTEGIMREMEAAKPGSRWAIGTEVHLVNRLCAQAAKRGVEARILSDCQCLCTTMYRIDRRHLLWVMDRLIEGEVVNRIAVDEAVKQNSLLALDRMLKINAMTGLKAPTPDELAAG